MIEQPNLNYIKQLADDSEAFEQKLIAVIQREFPEERTIFLENFKNKKFSQAAENVHKLKHKIGMLGFDDGYELTVAFEEDLKSNITQLYPKFLLILEAIDKFLKTL
ncbi:Hpt domain-containing protein [Aquimarina sp. W85]|uniref:Hpt domain-containing protein n=1 Tax=Aquimarina rhodophyticola TaxID=3342246 RepID=UPI00366CBCC2